MCWIGSAAWKRARSCRRRRSNSSAGAARRSESGKRMAAMSDGTENPYAAPHKPADADSLEWGSTPPREYRYRKFVRWSGYLDGILGGLIVVLHAAYLALLWRLAPFQTVPIYP